jgi:hypothetical protein
MSSERHGVGGRDGRCTAQPGLRGRWVTKRVVSEKEKGPRCLTVG